VRWLVPEEHICHPLPPELANGEPGHAPVIAKITCRWGKE
jgi:hypothetical protein